MHVYMYVYVNIHLCMYLCTCVCVRAHMCVCMYMCACVLVRGHVCTRGGGTGSGTCGGWQQMGVDGWKRDLRGLHGAAHLIIPGPSSTPHYLLFPLPLHPGSLRALQPLSLAF